jgi:uncharacterized protein (DUF1800 family)
VIGPTPREIEEASHVSFSGLVDDLLADYSAPPPPAEWALRDPIRRPLTQEQRDTERLQVNELRAWWAELIVNQPLSIRERMVLFWHDHFATQAVDVRRPQFMYQQNALFREHALGNFKTLVQEVTRDPAMLYYLDGVANQAGRPNENYARELMELFTMGVGNYTEEDVGEAARALTGWTVEGRQPLFVGQRFDSGVKQFLGRSGTFTDRDIIDVIFDQDVTAPFLCRKLYQAFVYDIPDETVVAQMAELLRSNNYEVLPVLEALLKSTHFYEDATIGARIKSPIELVAGSLRTFGIQAGSGGEVPGDYVVVLCDTLGQHLLDPPNVAGWPGYRTWISTATLPNRHQITDEIVGGNPRRIRGQQVSFAPDVIQFIRSMPNPWDAIELVRSLGRYLTPFEVDADRQELLLSVLLQGAEVYDWNLFDPNARNRVERLLKVVLELPDYQLA